LKLAFLQHPQNFDLQRGTHLTDFVEENGAPVGEFKTPQALGSGTRKGALLMPKELAFEQILRNGATVDRDERFVLAIAAVVERPRDEFLARTALPVDEDRAVSIRHLLDLG